MMACPLGPGVAASYANGEQPVGREDTFLYLFIMSHLTSFRDPPHVDA